jgi:hypothetical protein
MSTRILIRTNRLIVFRVRDESVVRTPHREHAFDENHPHGDLRWFRYFIQLLFPVAGMRKDPPIRRARRCSDNGDRIDVCSRRLSIKMLKMSRGER